MPLTILPRENPTSNWQSQLGANLGTGLGQGLSALLQSKLGDAHGQKVSNLFQKAGYAPEQADLLAHLNMQNPSGFHNILGMINPEIGAQQEQGMMQPEQMSNQQVRQPLFASKRQVQKELKKQQYIDKISEGLKLEDQTLGIIDQMLEDIKSGKVYSGPLIDKVAKHTPSFLNEQTERFDKNASEYINLMTQNMKGVPSRLRIQLQQQAKPGLRHSLKVNQDILERKRLELIKNRENVLKKNPELNEFFGIQSQQSMPEQQMMQQQSQQQNQQQSNIRYAADGSVEAFDPNTGQWRKARIKG